MTDSVAKVSWMGSPRNVRSSASSVWNLPCHANPGDESMLRASQPERLLQQYRPKADMTFPLIGIQCALQCSSRRRRRDTVAAVHFPSPLGVGTSSSFNARAIPRSDAVRSGSTRSMIGAIDRACWVAFSARAARALAVSAAVPARPRKPPSRVPRALLAANAAFAGGNHAGLQLGNRHHTLQE